jgi:hypothetical protein
MRRLLAAAALVVIPASLAGQKSISLGPQIVFGDYREVSADLHYRGSGGGLMASIGYNKISVEASVAKIKYKPTIDGTATASFDATQTDVRVRYAVSGPVTAEVGFTNREAEPEFEAQSVGAVTAGARMSYLLGPGVRMNLRGGLLFGAKFSGGGKSSPLGAIELGLGVGIDALRGRLRFTGAYDFQRITREADDGSGEVEVPIQQSLGRLGIAIVF